MIRIEIYRKNSDIFKFTISGHANYAKFGEDIVCSSVTTSATQTLNALLELLNLNPEYEYKEGFISCNLEDTDLKGKMVEVNILLEAMYKMLEAISNEYSKQVKLIEKEVSQ